MRIITCLMPFALLAATPAAASVEVANTLYVWQSETSSPLLSGLGRSTWVSQSFVSTANGTLTGLDLQISRYGSDPLRIVFGLGDVTDAGYGELFTLDLDNMAVPTSPRTLMSVDLSGFDYQLVAGQRYSVILRSPLMQGGNQFGWLLGEMLEDGTEITNPLTDGSTWASTDYGATWEVRAVTRPLRIWADVAGVPEPASWAMLIAGFGVVGMVARRRRRLAA